MTLRRDGRRVSLEGVLTGAALGIFLLYLIEDAAMAAMGPSGGGPVGDPGPLDLGDFSTRTGRIRVAPLGEVLVESPQGRRMGPGSGDGGGQPDAGGIGQGGGGQVFAGRRPQGLAEGRLSFVGGSAPEISGGGGGNTPQPPGPQPPGPEPPGPPGPEPPNPEPEIDQLPQMMLVVVRTNGAGSSRSLEGTATTTGEQRQVGIEDSVIDLRGAAQPALELRSDRLLPSSAVSSLESAELDLIARHVGLLRSTFLQGKEADVLVLGARDLPELATLAATEAKATLQSRTIGLDRSQISTGGGDDLIGLEALTKLTYTGVGTADRAQMSFDLLTQALKDSSIHLGNGIDTITINSGFYEGAGDLFQAAAADGGLSFFLGGSDPLAAPTQDWSFSLNATAMGLQRSLIDTGAGDDSLSLLTRIDENLEEDLLTLRQVGVAPAIELQRIGMMNSTIRMGPGNDTLRMNGSVIDSTISMGSGVNQLILEGPLLGNSRVDLGENEGSSVNFIAGLGGLAQGGPGADLFQLGNLTLAGEVNGGGGLDTLESTGSLLGTRDLLVVNKPNEGNLAGVRFRDVETVVLGDGNDVAVMDLNGTLTGQLLGGNGLDRLEFTEWSPSQLDSLTPGTRTSLRSVNVDLDLGIATGIYGERPQGISGFEQVVGGLGNDVLATSGAFAGIDGSDGDDVLYLRWSPWLTPANGLPTGEGVQLRGGSGQDRFVISGLEAALPAGWDGRSGLPVLQDLDLSLDTRGAGGIGLVDRLAWQQQVLLPSGETSQVLQDLTPGGLEAIGDARLLPIAPLEQLLAGMSDDTRQLAIAADGLPGGVGVLHLLGSQGRGTSQPVALIESELGQQRPIGSTSVDGVI